MKRQIELSRATAYTGTCADMCPEREREARLGFQLSIFERDQEDQPDEGLMVKEYRRAGADQEEPAPDDLRTPRALEVTMDHLVGNIMDDRRSLSPDLALEWYDFLWDRLRAIRKDITQQNICDQDSAILVERCTRFHVHSCYAMNHIKDFDVDMNKRNLNDCLQMLRQMYNDLKNEGTLCDGELEFQKYNILLHLDEDPLSTTVLMKTSDHRSSMEMKFIIQIFNAYLSNDYYRFFQLMQCADYITSCILSLYVNRLRLKALKIMLSSCTLRQMVLYPADLVVETLGFDDLNDLNNFVAVLDIKFQEKSSKHYLIFTKDLSINMNNVDRASLPPFKSRRLVENKMLGKTVGELVYGSHNEPIPIELELDRSMRPEEKPVVELADIESQTSGKPERAPSVVIVPEEIVDGVNSSPIIEAELKGSPKPDVTWFKDGQPDQIAPIIVSAPKEVIAGRDSSPVLEAEVSGKPKIMPAGRFRRKTYAKPPRTRPQPKHIPPPPKPVICKSAHYKRKLADLQQAIKQESKANEKLLELIKVFF